ncbi:hypothetical protein OGAPHI_006756 [Ogataea philodendri]|uniref:Uncharacterized protein n=1 Tax=Ogataea philodendri TaxID=1378263 RepID=A0A9P8NYF2_9ASCO|nr:uncharacterized protein OGAPHI_006756 [Ogataea philodendri]KAH3661349.1 hypothetical protein OGAPHI_006756 [Ogataea philodendri]
MRFNVLQRMHRQKALGGILSSISEDLSNTSRVVLNELGHIVDVFVDCNPTILDLVVLLQFLVGNHKLWVIFQLTSVPHGPSGSSKSNGSEGLETSIHQHHLERKIECKVNLVVKNN